MGRPAIMTREPVALPEHELLARVFRTLGDPTRLRLLEVLLDRGEASQTELIHVVHVSQSRASEHLACLAWCGLVDAIRDGRVVRYRIADAKARDFLALARAFLAENPDAVGRCRAVNREVELADG